MNTAQKLTSLLALTAILLTPKITFAQTALGISAIPPRLEITVKPGEAVSKEIKVRNESKVPRYITVSTKDFIVTDENTPRQIETSEDENRWAASSWIQISQTKFSLKPGETKSLTLTVIAPDNATPGGHYAMVIHSPQNDTVLTETGSFVETNVGTLLYITVPGNVKESAIIKDFLAPSFSEYGPINFKTIINNLSDVHIAPAGTINVTNWFGGRTTNIAFDTANIFPLTSRSFTSVLNKKWLFGRYTAKLNLAYGQTGQALSTALVFWVIPWRLLILIIAAIATISALIILFTQKEHQDQKNEEKVEELEEELEKLKKKYQDRK